MCASCSAKQQPSVSKVTPNKSVKVANIKPIKTKEIKAQPNVAIHNLYFVTFEQINGYPVGISE